MRSAVPGVIACLLTFTPPLAARTPNVVLFYADDLGVGDLGCFGCRDIQTPHIDALAASGVRMTNYYTVAPLCAPSRAALLTGRTPARAGMSLTHNVSSIIGKPGLDGDEITLAELAKTQGYATAVFGKWHLGASFDTQPNAQGFDLFLGHHASCVDSFSHTYYASEPYYHDLYRNRKEIHEDGVHMVDLITRETTRFIERHRDRPFLVYVAYNVPHYPMVAPGRYLERYQHLPRPRRDWAALTTHMDDSIGEIMACLERHDLIADTFVFFSSDNGVPNTSLRGEGGGSNAPYREYKRSLFEGGIHMPAIVSWPGHVPAGQVRDQLAAVTDVFPTVAQIIGATLPENRTYDGRSWQPMLADPAQPGHDMLFFEWNGQHAVRQGRWKVIRNGILGQDVVRQNRAAGEDFIFLTDLDADPGETTNLRAQHPDIAERLLAAHDRWRAEIAADLARRSRDNQESATETDEDARTEPEGSQ
jgi:arylsulfatase A-like enzyme